VIAAYGGKCGFCPEHDPAALSIDHINDDGATERRRLGVHTGAPTYRRLKEQNYPKDRYQLLCFNCQWKKREHGADPATWPT